MSHQIRKRSQSQWFDNSELISCQNTNVSNVSQPLKNKNNSNSHQLSTFQKQQSKPQVQPSHRKFTVAIRIKPQLNQINENAIPLLSMKIKNIDHQYKELSVSNQNNLYTYSQSLDKNKKFIFDKIYSQDSQNTQIYQSLLKQKIQLLKQGINLSVLAYGATNSGKTYTIFGKQSYNKSNIFDQSNGISLMIFRQILQQFHQQNTFQFSFLQIYNENIFDLLEFKNNAQSQLKPLSMMQDQDGDIHMARLKKKQIKNYEELFNFVQIGNERRTSCNNIHNAQSSRSHAFMQLQLTNKITRHKVKMVIVDLAGSEKYISNPFFNDKNASKSNILLKQGSNINKSLLSLGNCIKSLYEGEKHVPYRDSKLTRLLKQNLSGYSHNVMIACIGQSVQKWEESFNTLNYALKAMKIQKKLQKKYQNQQLSNYTCESCEQRLSYFLIKQILKNEEAASLKRVKKPMKASLSMPNSPMSSPIAQNSAVINWFSKSKKNAKKYLNSNSVKNKIEQSFVLMKKQLFEKTQQIMLASSEVRKQKINQFFQDKKRYLLSSLDSLLQTPQKQSATQQRNESNILDLLNQTTISQFNTTFRNNSSNCANFRQDSNDSNLTNKTRRVKISLSKNNKKEKYIQKNTNELNTCDKTSFSSILKTQRQISKNQTQKFSQFTIKSNENKKNLTVRVSDNQRVLQERKQVLNQLFLTHNQRKNTKTKLKSGSGSQVYKGKNVKAFQINHKSFDQQAQNLIEESLKNENFPVTRQPQDYFIKIEQQPDRIDNGPDNHISKNRMLDSTSIAPRMRRDQDQLVGTWKNIFIKKIESAKKQSDN